MAIIERPPVDTSPDSKEPLSIEKAVRKRIEIQGPRPEDTLRFLYGSPGDPISIQQENLQGESSILVLGVRGTKPDGEFLREIVGNLPARGFEIKESSGEDEEDFWAIVSPQLTTKEVRNVASELAGIGDWIAEM